MALTLVRDLDVAGAAREGYGEGGEGGGQSVRQGRVVRTEIGVLMQVLGKGGVCGGLGVGGGGCG